jgi:acetyltransferase-like isoleucine patch superfamily enzyme
VRDYDKPDIGALRPSNRAPGLLLGDGVEVGRDVEISGNVVIHAGTRIGSRTVIQDGAIIGKRPRWGPQSSAPRDAVAGAVLGEDCAILAGAIVFAGATLGRGAIAADQTQIRERTVIGTETVIGRGSAVTAYAQIADDVFIGPGVTMTNDHTMGRHAKDLALEGPRLRRACRVGGGAVLCPGVEIGEEAFVAAGAVVVADVPSRTVVMGVPARRVREIPEGDVLEQWP